MAYRTFESAANTLDLIQQTGKGIFSLPDEQMKERLGLYEWNYSIADDPGKFAAVCEKGFGYHVPFGISVEKGKANTVSGSDNRLAAKLDFDLRHPDFLEGIKTKVALTHDGYEFNREFHVTMPPVYLSFAPYNPAELGDPGKLQVVYFGLAPPEMTREELERVFSAGMWKFLGEGVSDLIETKRFEEASPLIRHLEYRGTSNLLPLEICLYGDQLKPASIGIYQPRASAGTQRAGISLEQMAELIGGI